MPATELEPGLRRLLLALVGTDLLGLTPAITLTRWWHAWSKAPPPAELQHLIDNVTAGHGLFLYLPP